MTVSNPNTFDTIVAIATPRGRGGLGVVRLSGPKSLAITRDLFGETAAEPARLRRTQLRDEQSALDDVLVVYFLGPRSYTGEDVVEISCHGSPVLLDLLVRRTLERGARMAEPGEFTRRAFLNGRIDLTQAEAIRDLIEAQTLLQVRTAARQLYGSVSRRVAPVKEALKELIARMEAGIDFADDDVTFLDYEEIANAITEIARSVGTLADSFRAGRTLREGVVLAVVGKPNVGKSSLFNRLLANERAIVTATPGTTRDSISEATELFGLPLTLIDTAGIRDPEGEAERLGIERSWAAIADAEAVIAVFDASRPLDDDDAKVTKRVAELPRVLYVLNKCDLPERTGASDLVRLLDCGTPGISSLDTCRVSALRGDGMDELRACIARELLPPSTDDAEPVTNLRQWEQLSNAGRALAAGLGAVGERLPHEVLLVDLYDALRSLDRITGDTGVEDILGLIFSTFCIGK